MIPIFLPIFDVIWELEILQIFSAYLLQSYLAGTCTHTKTVV